MKQFLSISKPHFLFPGLLIVYASLIPALSFSAARFLNSAKLPQTSYTASIIAPLDDDSLEIVEEDNEAFTFTSNLIIKAVNPGYSEKDDAGKTHSNVGELIELQQFADTSISLAGFSLRYTNGSGNSSIIFDFPEGSLMTGETLLLRYAKSDSDAPSDAIYSSSLALSAGPLELLYEGEVIDSVCWTGKNGCNRAFKSAQPTTLVRDLATGEFVHLDAYSPAFNPDSPSLYLPPEPELPEEDPEESASPQCYALEFSEILSYYADDQSEQFIELYNPTTKTVSLDGCQIRYKKKTYALSGSISADSYYAYYPGENFSLTKNPTSSNSVELLDTTGEVVDELLYPNGQKKSTSYARFFDYAGTESWSKTYTPTPGSANVYQEFRTCESGKVINPATGNCVKADSLTTTLSECPAGKYRNPLTGRCKSIETESSGLKECAEGYERNPATNRCRKITSDNDGADYALVPATRTNQSVFIAAGIVILLVLSGVIYIALQFRREIARAARKASQHIDHIRKDLLAGRISLHRHKKP